MKKAVISLTIISVLTLAAKGNYVVFDNGGPTIYSYGNDIWRWLQADDFVLAQDSILTGAHFWTQEGHGYVWDGTLEYFIFADSYGMPGTIMSSGDGQSVIKSATGNATPGSEEYEYSFAFETPIVLAAHDTYWFGLHLASTYPAETVYWPWSTSVSGFGSTGFESKGGTLDNWVDSGIHRAFYLEAVPEPATLSLFAMGVLALVRKSRIRNRS